MSSKCNVNFMQYLKGVVFVFLQYCVDVVSGAPVCYGGFSVSCFTIRFLHELEKYEVLYVAWKR